MADVKNRKTPGRRGKNQAPRKKQVLLSENAPFAYVEAFKSLRTNLEFVSSVDDARCIVVTSALPEECKSTTSLNLALSLAENGRNVVLVECDLRKPVLRKYLKIDRTALGAGLKGLSSFLAGDASLAECICRVKKHNISVIVAGSVPPNPSELLSHGRMNALIKKLREGFDYVILDAPPVTVVTDAAVVGRMADGALLVVRSKYASTKSIRLAKQKLEDVNVKILGSVITRFDMKKSGWRSGYNYEDYEYGYSEPRENK